MTDYATLWVCIDCHMTAANGETIEDRDERAPEPWSDLNGDTRSVTPGLMASEHDEDCSNFDADGSFLGVDDEPCETEDFSWRRCDGCGSTLGGARFAYTLHFAT